MSLRKIESALKKFLINLVSDWKFLNHRLCYCTVCERRDVSFLPLPAYYRDHANCYGFIYFGRGEMTSHKTYSCSNCGASDRERLYALWLDQQLSTDRFLPRSRFIHFAPERALSKKLRQIPLIQYVTADLAMDAVDYKLDMMAMPFNDASFDFFICSHVLEHVEDDMKAIQELYRITKRGGCGILMVPIIFGLDRTIEDSRITDQAGRWKHFGQHDHVRLYARSDFIRKIKKSGFGVLELGENYFGKRKFQALGLKRTSILYVAIK